MKKIQNGSDAETELCNDIAYEVFMMAVEKGGNLPMIYLMETFLMVAARIATDLYNKIETSPTKEQIYKIANGAFSMHFEQFLREQANTSNNVN